MRLFARLGLLLALFALAGVSGAAACSIVIPSFGTLVQESAVIAVGTIDVSTSNGATIDVEQYLKGAGVSEITLFDYDADCTRTLGSGDRFAEGTRLVLFLDPNTATGEARWQTSTLMMGEGAAWVIIDDQVYTGSNSTMPLAEMTTQIMTELGVDGTLATPTLPAPWALLALGVVFGGLALWGWARGRRAED